MIYIMRRTQLYLDESLWSALHAHARSRKTSVSELVREAVRERYLGNKEKRREAMLAFIGVAKNKTKVRGSTDLVRELRRGSRLERFTDK